jgi:hypothetical protein
VEPYIEISYEPQNKRIQYLITAHPKSELTQYLLAKLHAFPMCVCIYYEQRLLVLKEYKVAIYAANLDELDESYVVATSPLQLNTLVQLDASSLSEHVIAALLQKLNFLLKTWLDEEAINMQISHHHFFTNNMKKAGEIEW